MNERIKKKFHTKRNATLYMTCIHEEKNIQHETKEPNFLLTSGKEILNY